MKFNTVDEYIASFDVDGQKLLTNLRQIIRSSTPEGTMEVISYNMPTWKYSGILIHIALYKHHIGIYPGPLAISHFSNELTPYKCSKGAIQIPRDKPIPQDLIEKIVQFNIATK